jgi:hypothetical protein
MALAQLTYRDSLRDIEACLGSIGGKLYRRGFRGKIAHSTLADANQARDWRIDADFRRLCRHCPPALCARSHRRRSRSESLRVGPHHHRFVPSFISKDEGSQTQGAAKIRTLLDLRGNIPMFIRITEGSVHDLNILDEIMPEPGAFDVMDRAYVDFERLLPHPISDLRRSTAPA